ncbi:hypothetical protein C0992_008164 [Termitomyces sp. T32_za158]|nr:hypothetical protein C0992_008164 [Termitomyces sp. T32_za158]
MTVDYTPLPGRPGNLSVVQAHALQKLKQELIDDGIFVEGRMDDALLLRFLRARKFDVAKAKEMLVDTENWRKENGVDTIIEYVLLGPCVQSDASVRSDFDFTERIEVNKYYPQYYHKMDKVRLLAVLVVVLSRPQDGRPIYIERLGLLDLDALYKATTQDRLIKRFIQEYEKFDKHRVPACAAAVGHPVETSCTILDLANVSLTSFYRVKDYIMQASSIGQDRYPERMGKFYIINAPWAFSAVWKVIKPWLDDVTVSKVDILGSGYKETLLGQIPAENLPVAFGGTCACPGGCALSDAGPWNVNAGGGGD